MVKKKKEDEMIFDNTLPVSSRDAEVDDTDAAQPLDARGNKLLDEDGTIVKAPAKDEERLPEFGGNDVEDKTPIVCEACDDRGAVPKTIVNGVVTEWKDCPKCYRYELKDSDGGIVRNALGQPKEVRRLYGVDYNV